MTVSPRTTVLTNTNPHTTPFNIVYVDQNNDLIDITISWIIRYETSDLNIILLRLRSHGRVEQQSNSQTYYFYY